MCKLFKKKDPEKEIKKNGSNLTLKNAQMLAIYYLAILGLC